MNVSSTVLPSETPSAVWEIIGYVALLASCTAFGTMFVPIRKADCKDGFFVQWIECGVVFIVGCVVYCVRDFPTFEPVACIGGLLYATGNVFSVPIVQGIGMGVGFLIWSSLQILVGWSVARFGLFGWIAAQQVKNDALNYIGIVLTIISGFILIFVKHAPIEEDEPKSYEVVGPSKSSEAEDPNETKTDLAKKIPFVIMAMGLAAMHGLMMSPIDYLKQKHPSNDKFRVFDYVFPFYASVFVFSTIYFFAYAIIRRRRMHVESEVVLPAIGYGVLWTTGMTLWFVSSDRLSQVVAYPITTRLPPIISALIDVFVYKTVKGSRQLSILALAAVIALTGVILIALSNQI